LFGEPSASQPGKSRQPDFGPSILATIDGTPRRDAHARDATPLKRVLWMSLLAVGLVAVYFAVKLGMLPSASSSSPAQAVAVAQAPAPVVKAGEPLAAAVPVAQVASAASASDGAASIETVTTPVVVAAASADAATPAASNVATSLNNIQQVLASADAREPRKAAKPVAPKDPAVTAPLSTKDMTMATRGAAPAPKPTTKSANDDAELIAAMLPHLKRRGTAPTSPGYEKRCGHLDGDAAVDCRVKFCNGREGVDAACPSAVSR
jgi:hypothetical protein